MRLRSSHTDCEPALVAIRQSFADAVTESHNCLAAGRIAVRQLQPLVVSIDRVAIGRVEEEAGHGSTLGRTFTHVKTAPARPIGPQAAAAGGLEACSTARRQASTPSLSEDT